MSGDLSSVGFNPTGHGSHASDSADFASACVRADRRPRLERADGRPAAASGNTSADGSDAAQLPPGVSVQDAADSAQRGTDLVAAPEPPKWTVDERIAWNEAWLAKAQLFFNDPLAAKYLTPEQLSAVRAALKSYSDQIKAFKELVAKYRAEGKEPSPEEIKAAFSGMREVRRELKSMIATVVTGVIEFMYSSAMTGLDSWAFTGLTELAGSIMASNAMFQSMLNEVSVSAADEMRNARFMDQLRNAFSRLRDMREAPQAEHRP